MDAKFLGLFVPSLRYERRTVSVFRAAGENPPPQKKTKQNKTKTKPHPRSSCGYNLSHGVIGWRKTKYSTRYLILSPQQPCYSKTQVKWRAFPWKHCLHCNPQFCHKIIQMILEGEQHLYTSECLQLKEPHALKTKKVAPTLVQSLWPHKNMLPSFIMKQWSSCVLVLAGKIDIS